MTESIEAFCQTTSELEQNKLDEKIRAKLNRLSVNLTYSCKICTAESMLRTFLIGDETLNVIKGIGIYVSILAIMLQHGLKPQLSNKKSVESLLLHLKNIVEPPNFFPMTRVRRDIETVIRMLPAFERLLREEKIKRATGLVEAIKIGAKTEKVAKLLKKHFDHQSWTRDYLVISWLNMQVSCVYKSAW